MIQIKNFLQVEQYLNSLVRQGSRQIFQGEKGLEKMKYYLSLLGSPQNKLKIIHVAGTAGKGSTCYLTSTLLATHGFKVGLHLSPHLTDVRERFQINNKIISKKEFIFYLNKIIPLIKKVEKSKYGVLSYFEVLVGLAFYIFYKKKVDYAVIETGLGGLYDATNVVDKKDKISVLTKIGYDHTEILGKTLEEITFQKAMIINEKSQVVVLNQPDKIKKIIKQVAEKKLATIFFVNKTRLDLSLLGDYQKENAGLALKTIELISQRDGFKISTKKIKKAFNEANFIGRFDIKKIKDKTVILDGAHNQPKMEAFTSSLKEKYPNQKFHFLIAFKKGKDYENMIRYIIPLSSKITVTSFFVDNQDLIHLSEKPEVLVDKLIQMNFKNYQVIEQSKQALNQVLKSKQDVIVITGSLYLLGEIYRILKS